MKRVTLLSVLLILSVLAACGPSAPTATPRREPRPTQAEVLATKPEHLAGTWLVPWMHTRGPLYVRFEGDGTMCDEFVKESQDGLEECPEDGTRFWFEDGVYYEDFGACPTIGAYRAYLEIEGGRAVGLRFEEVEDTASSMGGVCNRDWRMDYEFARVDR